MYVAAPCGLPSPARKPNFVAMTTSDRCSLNARPRNSSERVPPYASAVSNNVMPASRAASTTASVPAWSTRMPKLLQPSPTSETVRLPSERVSIART
jgi:hypothetical protein